MANIYMTFYENMALDSAKVLGIAVPSLWLRYVDDVFILFRLGREALDDFVSFLNTLRSSIQFTLECEQDDCLPFLDLHIKKVGSGLSFSVYRKPTHTDRYLQRSSCHPRSVFVGIVKCLRSRAERVCSGAALRKEKVHLKKVLTANGYTSKDTRALFSVTRGKKTRSIAQKKCGGIPYLPGLSERIKRTFKRVGSDVYFRPPFSLRGVLSKKRPKGMERLGLVYRIPCGDCGWSYVGETGRSLRVRISEHKRAVKNFSTSSEIANHVWEYGHKMRWEAAVVLAEEKDHFKRVFKEAWFTRQQHSGNRVFHELSGAWNVLF
jgi:hypothetical protein